MKRVSPVEAKALLDNGYHYVDVRSEQEFAAEHPVGASNVPLMMMGAGGMSPNPDFLAVMRNVFPKDAKLVLGCKAGGRSLRAAEMLAADGYLYLADQRAGFDGARDAFGALQEPGWKATGLQSEQGAGGARSYENLRSLPASLRLDP